MLEELISGKELILSDSQKIYLNETKMSDDTLQINCEFRSLGNYWKDIFRFNNRKVKANYRNFEGENDIFRVEYTFLEIPKEEGYSTILSPYINMNPSDLELVLNQVKVVFKDLLLNEDSYRRYNSSCRGEHNKLRFIYGDNVGEFMEPERNISIEYIEVPFNNQETILFPSTSDLENHFRVFSRLGLDNVWDYEEFINNFPNLRTLYSEHPSENLIQIKVNLYNSLIKLITSLIDIDDTKIKSRMDDFFNSYLKTGISRDTSFLFNSGGAFSVDQDKWEELHAKNIYGDDCYEKYSYAGFFVPELIINNKSKKKLREEKKRKRNLKNLKKSREKKQKKLEREKRKLL